MPRSEDLRNPPKAILFDIGRVIVRVDPDRAIAPLTAALSSSSATGRQVRGTPGELWAALEADPCWASWQEGRLTASQWHEYVGQRLGISLNFQDFCDAWNRVLDPETILCTEMFVKLGTRCRLGLLSNIDPIHAEYIENHFAFVREFPVRIYSCNIASRKPLPAIYHAALRALGTVASDTLYVDDIPEFAESARRLGLDAIRFENPQQLQQELALRGLAPE